jgi:hypothetical protein
LCLPHAGNIQRKSEEDRVLVCSGFARIALANRDAELVKMFNPCMKFLRMGVGRNKGRKSAVKFTEAAAGT